MKESFFTGIRNIFHSREITAGEAMASFVHKKTCPAYGMDVLDSVEFLQIGRKQVWTSGGEPWGGGFGTVVNITYIQCSDCGEQKIFQENGERR